MGPKRRILFPSQRPMPWFPGTLEALLPELRVFGQCCANSINASECQARSVHARERKLLPNADVLLIIDDVLSEEWERSSLPSNRELCARCSLRRPTPMADALGLYSLATISLVAKRFNRDGLNIRMILGCTLHQTCLISV